MVLEFSRKYPKIYGLLQIVLFLFFLAALSILPYVYRALTYPVFFEKEYVSGVIEEVAIKTKTVHVKHRSQSMPDYYFIINDTCVRVTPSIVRQYEEGDVYEYIQYSCGSKVVGESREYSLVWGIVALLFVIWIGYVTVFSFSADSETNPSEKKPRKMPIPMDYSQLSKKELYELCQSRNISIMEGKRGNKKYLENCLRKEDKSNKWLAGQERKEKSAGRFVTIIAIVLLLFIIKNYSEFIYYFIYLFT